MKMKFCKNCLDVINSIVPPSEKEWERFQKCRCLQRNFRYEIKEKKYFREEKIKGRNERRKGGK